MSNVWDYETTGRIIGHRFELPFGAVRVEYEWQGDKFCRVSWDLLGDFWDYKAKGEPKPGDVFWVGPFKLLVVERENIWTDNFICLRMPSFIGVVQIIFKRLLRVLHLIYCRLILTAFIWGWAKRPDAYAPYTWQPSWRDLRWPGWREREERRQAHDRV